MLYRNALDGEEKILFSRFGELAELAIKRHQPQFSCFLNPREQKIAFAATRQKGNLFGGYKDATRQIAGFPTPFGDISEKDFPLKAVELSHDESTQLPHQWVLGSLMGLGITRGSIGDILPSGGICVILTTIPVASVILNELEQVGSVHVKIKEINLNGIVSSQEYCPCILKL